jgi:hypothetical protein
MSPYRNRSALLASAVFLAVLCGFLPAAPAAAQSDVVTVGTVNASGSTVDVPVYIRDVSGTPLGKDKPAGSKIQSFSIKVTYAPAGAVSSVTFTRAGITAGLSPTSEFMPATTGSISLLATFQESTASIPFTLNAPAPGDQVAHLVFNLSASAAPGTSISLTLDSALTQLTDEGGNAATKETTGNGTLALVNGAINLAPLTIQITPPSQNINLGSGGFISVIASAKVASNTTLNLSSSNTGVATVPPTATIPAGSNSVDVAVSTVALGGATITASIPGGASATGNINVVNGTVPCADPSAPQPSAPATADAGSTYSVTWQAVAGATEYLIDESTDPNFASGTTTKTVTTPSASYSHTPGGVRYYYRVRSRNHGGTCDNTSLSSNTVSVLVNAVSTPVPTVRVLPVVGSAAGGFGSFFKTSLQLYNPKSVTVSGKIVYHPQGISGSASDPSLAYSLAPGKTLSYADLLPAMGVASGVGTADVISDATSPLPQVLARVFNDAGVLGTTGLAEEMVAPADALTQGSTGALFAPADAAKFRLNIGIRTLDAGAAMNITVRDKDGAVVKTTTKSYGPTFFIQIASSALLDGYLLSGSETISFELTSGSAFLYGSTTDNITNDPSLQLARKIE